MGTGRKQHYPDKATQHMPAGVDDNTLEVYKKREEPATCPDGRYLLGIVADQAQDTIVAYCQPCHESCENCLGPSIANCSACGTGLLQIFSMDGESNCVNECPECF